MPSQPNPLSSVHWTALETAQRLPAPALAQEIAALLQDPSVQVPARSVLPLPQDASLLVMPAHDALIAMTKLITYTPANQGQPWPVIQGDVVVFDVHTGRRLLVLDGPTVTAQRTAAVSLLAAQRLAPVPHGPLLLIGAGVQGLAHAQAFVQGLGVKEVWVLSRSRHSAEQVVNRLHEDNAHLGVTARVVTDVSQAVAHCPLIVTATPAQQPVLNVPLSADHFVAAVGAFTPHMVEVSATVCQQVARAGCIVLDTPDARHEAGDLIQAGVDTSVWPTLQEVVRGTVSLPTRGTGVLFKSCGWAGWDLAAARLAVAGDRA